MGGASHADGPSDLYGGGAALALVACGAAVMATRDASRTTVFRQETVAYNATDNVFSLTGSSNAQEQGAILAAALLAPGLLWFAWRAAYYWSGAGAAPLVSYTAVARVALFAAVIPVLVRANGVVTLGSAVSASAAMAGLAVASFNMDVYRVVVYRSLRALHDAPNAKDHQNLHSELAMGRVGFYVPVMTAVGVLFAGVAYFMDSYSPYVNASTATPYPLIVSLALVSVEVAMCLVLGAWDVFYVASLFMNLVGIHFRVDVEELAHLTSQPGKRDLTDGKDKPVLGWWDVSAPLFHNLWTAAAFVATAFLLAETTAY